MMRKEFPTINLQGMPHINSKLTTWKKNHGSLMTMIAQSGVGFNLKGTHMIDCEDDLWKIIVQNDPNARTMRYQDWPLFSDWQEIFGKDRATGESAKDVMEAVNELMKDDNMGQGNHENDYHVDLDGILGDGNEEGNSVCQSDKGNAAQPSTSKKLKTIEGLEGVYDLLR